MKKFRYETRNVRVLVVAVGPYMLKPFNSNPTLKNRYLLLKDIFDEHIASKDTISLREEYLPFRTSIRSIFLNHAHENLNSFDVIRLRAKSLQYRLNENDSRYKHCFEERSKSLAARDAWIDGTNKMSAMQFHFPENTISQYRDARKFEDIFFDLAKMCEEQGIHVVFVTVPTFTGQYYAPWEASNLNMQEYIQLLSKLNQLANCTTISTSLIEDIHPGCEPLDCFYDSTHMTEKGALVYTDWLAKEMKKNPKIVAALKTPRKSEDSFVKKYIKKGKRAISKVLPGKKPKTEAVAAPLASGPVR